MVSSTSPNALRVGVLPSVQYSTGLTVLMVVDFELGSPARLDPARASLQPYAGPLKWPFPPVAPSLCVCAVLWRLRRHRCCVGGLSGCVCVRCCGGSVSIMGWGWADGGETSHRHGGSGPRGHWRGVRHPLRPLIASVTASTAQTERVKRLRSAPWPALPRGSTAH